MSVCERDHHQWRVHPLRLPYRSPLDLGGLIAFLGRRAVPGVEEVIDGGYRRSLRLAGGPAVIELAPGSSPAACGRASG